MKKERIISLKKIIDSRGNLSFFESNTHIPFEINRTYWIYDVPRDKFREPYAFSKSDEFIVALSGSFDINLSDGRVEKKYSLNKSNVGLYIPNLTWITIGNFSTDSLALVVSSLKFDKRDYINDFDEFLNLKNEFTKK